MTIGLDYRALSSMQALGGRAGPSRRGRAVRSRHDTASVSRQKTMTLRLSVQRTSLRVMNWSATTGMPCRCRIDGSDTTIIFVMVGWYYFCVCGMNLRIPTQKKIGKEPITLTSLARMVARGHDFRSFPLCNYVPPTRAASTFYLTSTRRTSPWWQNSFLLIYQFDTRGNPLGFLGSKSLKSLQVREPKLE